MDRPIDAYVVTAFGSTMDYAQSTYRVIDQKLRDHLQLPIHWAYTSGMVRKNLLQKNRSALSPAEAIRAAVSEGSKHVHVPTLFVIAGEEYEKAIDAARDAAGLQSVSVGKPLLWDAASVEWMAQQMKSAFENLADGEAVLWMGHGSHHQENKKYHDLNNCHIRIHSHHYVACVEGSPVLSEAMGLLQSGGYHTVHLVPLLLVVGDHAINDMAGDEEDSWKIILQRAGYGVKCHLRGLLEMPAVAERLLFHG